MLKTCTRCKQTKDLTDFALRSKVRQGTTAVTKRFTLCRDCRSELHLRYHYQKKYGLSWEEYQKLLLAQDFKCKCCGRLADGGRSSWSARPKLVLDHNHKTGRHRGLVCNRCNWALGVIENRRLMKMLKNYLALYEIEDL